MYSLLKHIFEFTCLYTCINVLYPPTKHSSLQSALSCTDKRWGYGIWTQNKIDRKKSKSHFDYSTCWITNDFSIFSKTKFMSSPFLCGKSLVISDVLNFLHQCHSDIFKYFDILPLLSHRKIITIENNEYFIV